MRCPSSSSRSSGAGRSAASSRARSTRGSRRRPSSRPPERSSAARSSAKATSRPRRSTASSSAHVLGPRTGPDDDGGRVSKHVVVIGGSVAGLGVALALSGRGQRVTILEADATPLPASHRRGLRALGAPRLAAGTALARAPRAAPQPDPRPRPGAAREAPRLRRGGAALHGPGAPALPGSGRSSRATRTSSPSPAGASPSSGCCGATCWTRASWTSSDGVEVTRLEAERDAATALPRVTGVWARTRDGGEALVSGDLVVDASGRRSKLRSWLPAIGTPPVREASSPCGIFYTSRFYRLLDGAEAPPLDGGIVGVDLGYLKLGDLRGRLARLLDHARRFADRRRDAPRAAPARLRRGGGRDAARCRRGRRPRCPSRSPTCTGWRT